MVQAQMKGLFLVLYSHLLRMKVGAVCPTSGQELELITNSFLPMFFLLFYMSYYRSSSSAELASVLVYSI